MSPTVSLNTPLAEALAAAIPPKLIEIGWGSGGSNDAAMAEFIVLMLVNGKTQDQISSEFAADLLGLPPDDPVVANFSKWLFEQIDILSAQTADAGEQTGAETTAKPAPENNLSGDMDTDMNTADASPDLKAPTGPRSMRNGTVRGGRDKRMLGHMNKALDRSGENALHRTRGNDRINTHNRAPPTGPRAGPGRPARMNNAGPMRAANLQAGLAAGGPQGANWSMQGPQLNQMEVMAMLEQQSQMMFQLSQQIMQGGGPNGGPGQQRPGKSLFDRVSDPQHRQNYRKGQNHHHNRANGQGSGAAAGGGSGDGGGADVDMEMTGTTREAPNPDETVCKYNLNCTNRDCRFAHQSPAAPLGASVDVSDTCSFGAACKNRKCVARHPSPATKLAHQSEQACKFFPNCHNVHCPFKHPSKPLCRNGPGCSTTDCQFTHIKTKCRFNPCLNPKCIYTHEPGQQGGFRDKVWTAGNGAEHVSERKFVDEQAATEDVKPDEDSKPAPVAAASEVAA